MIPERDVKILWGRAAGTCSNSECRAKLSENLAAGGGFVLGEMAHIIAKQPDGPRGGATPGSNNYPNLILLCPNCHTHIDKNPEKYPVSLLQQMKESHEEWVRIRLSTPRYSSIEKLKSDVAQRLRDNGAVFRNLGPKSEAALDLASNAHIIWDLRKLDTIVPNNREIIKLLEANMDLLSEKQKNLLSDFKSHASSFEENQKTRVDKYPLFPVEFAREMGAE